MKLGALVAAFLVGLLSAISSANAFELAPYKDKLFSYPGIRDTSDGGNYVEVDYDKQRDIYGRDAEPLRRAKNRYVSKRPLRQQRTRRIEAGGVKMKYMSVGKEKGARMITVFIHGRNGNHLLGVNDYNFGGNFNRIKNLMVRNRGLYLSPDVDKFGSGRIAAVRAMIDKHRRLAPSAKVFIACGSQGSLVCWAMAKDPSIASSLGGILIMGGFSDSSIFSSSAVQRRVPIYIGHGTLDVVWKWEDLTAFYSRLRQQAGGNYPAKFALFNTGKHGTPIRMTDWRLILNWMLSLN